MKHWPAALAILAALSASLALADDFKTINGKEYKNATVTRVERDGIILKTKSGISKVYFVELPHDVQERFHPSPAKTAAAQTAAAQRQREPIKLEGWGSGDGKSDCRCHVLRCRDNHHCRRGVCYRPSSFSMTSNDASKV